MPAVKPSRPDKIDLEAAWREIKAGIDEFLDFLEGSRDEPASATANMGMYTKVYNMCTQVRLALRSNQDDESRASIHVRCLMGDDC